MKKINFPEEEIIMTKKENIEKEVKNVKAKVAEVKEKNALDLAVRGERQGRPGSYR